jgi:HEAT repeat protein
MLRGPVPVGLIRFPALRRRICRMPNSLHTTFEVLARTRNAAAVDVQIAALDLDDPAVQAFAAASILRRRPPRGIVELIRRLQELPEPVRQLMETPGTELGRGLRDCLLSSEAVLRGNALELVRRLAIYSEVPTLIALLQHPHIPERAAVEGVIFELVNRLNEQLRFGKDGEEGRAFLREGDRVRHQILAMLEAASYRYPTHRCRLVIEGLLILSDPENMHLKKFMRDATDEVRSVAADLFVTSRHPGVMGLVVDSMTLNYPFPAAMAAIEKRSDPEFILHLLRHWPRKLATFQQKNFREIRSVAWLDPAEPYLDVVPPALHRTLIAFVMSTGLPQPQKLAVLEWMVHCGSPAGRLAATDVLVDLEDDKVQEVVLESLESEEPNVQAWATSQLRIWEIPNAMELLVQRLDSPIPEVQEAARAELAGFDIYRAIEIFDHLDSGLQAAVGRLVRKIDPQTIPKLKEQMQDAIRRKRIRAARAALAMKLHVDVVDALLLMARDSDNLVRRTAAEVLGRISTREAVEMLFELTRDDSPRVRDAAVSALNQLNGTQDGHAASPTAYGRETTA